MYSVSCPVAIVLFFFFSSRRRHTRFKCDWSSDVCSSDLGKAAEVLQDLAHHRGDERTSAEMAVNGDVEKRRRLILVEVVEGVLVDVVPVAWLAAQHPMVGIVGVRKRHDRPVAVRCAEWQIAG